jgi:hypothetical protein
VARRLLASLWLIGALVIVRDLWADSPQLSLPEAVSMARQRNPEVQDAASQVSVALTQPLTPLHSLGEAELKPGMAIFMERPAAAPLRILGGSW